MAWETFEEWMREYPQWFRYVYYSVLCLVGAGCSYSIILTNMEGPGTDVVDQTQSTDPTIDPELKVPIKP